MNLIIFLLIFAISYKCIEGKVSSATNYNISDVELHQLSEAFFSEHSDKLFKLLNVNYQGKTTNKNLTDNAPNPLFNFPPHIFTHPTISALLKLYDNYLIDARQAEIKTDEEVVEENDFLDILINQTVVLKAMDFLADKGFFIKSLNEYLIILKQVWFQIYSRGKGIYGSSGFEHVFLMEKKKGSKLIGLHNWIFFAKQELSNKINYLGLIKNKTFYNKLEIAHVHLKYEGKHKTSSMFIGTPPEFEIAVYTLCFFARPQNTCKLSFGGKKFYVQTYNWIDKNYKLVGAAFPLI
ncbi:endoribonuclease CG2145-like [Prorops nasuta]|uniref:endoribonuclease CG2145-like n=1 Tax=Prorops nasuta TaxID=863751 RepID=UPI0034CD3022